MKNEPIVAGRTGDTVCVYGYLVLLLQGSVFTHLAVKYSALWEQCSPLARSPGTQL